MRNWKEHSIPEMARLAPSTTLAVDRDGIIYNLLDSSVHTGELRANVCYFPCDLSIAPKMSLINKRGYVKGIYDGRTTERNPLLSNELYDVVAKGFRTDSYGMGYVALAPRDIFEVFDGQASYRAIMRGVSGMPEVVQTTLDSFTTLYKSYGIPQTSLGVYGSTEALIVPTDPNGSVHDIDVVIHGLQNKDALKAMVSDFRLYSMTCESGCTPEGRLNPPKKQPKRRDAFTVMHINGMKVEIKLARTPEDKNDFPDLRTVQLGKETVIRGCVVDDTESAAIPSVWKVRTPSGKVVSVGSASFYTVGAAWEGDSVVIRGREVIGSNKYSLVVCSHDLKDIALIA
jgi:predicted nucleotidyltransferase